MKQTRTLSVLLALAFLMGCGLPGGNVDGDPTAGPQLPTPVVRITDTPDPKSALTVFLEAWKSNDFAAMYTVIAPESQQSITEEDFIKRYRNAMNSLTLKELTHEILAINTSPASAQVTFRVTYKTKLFGDLQRDMSTGLKLENGQWKIIWNDGLVLPELAGGNYLSMDYEVPTRGIIYDSQGEPFVSEQDAYALGLVPINITPDQEPTLINQLSTLLSIPVLHVLPIYDNQRTANWYIPVGEAPAEKVDRLYTTLSSLGGLVLSPYTARYYDLNGIAPQTIGYVSPVPAEELDQYVREGYSPGARVGRAGIEQWGEQYLSGKTGGTLYIVSPEGTVVSSLGKTDSQPAGSVYLTLDKDFQVQAQKAMDGFRGAIVVLERNSGKVLAMVSSPDYDPNWFEPNNANSGYGLGDVVNDANRPLVNRAVQGQYPLGSVFKVITFVAALESGTYTPDLKLECGYEWRVLTDKVRYDWTWEHCQDELATSGECRTRPSGELTLSQGLMRSCNPWFWHIGLDLYRQGRVSAVADMARAFGLSQSTNLGQIDEATGQIVNPAGEVEAVNQAIGQGDVQVTPLQVARFMAAIGNDGTLYRPQLVEKVVDASGIETTIFKPEAQGTLPLSPATLAALREAMREVVVNPRGTAAHRFRDFKIPVYGKTGTAESGSGLPHAWFAGYTDANNPDKPDIAIAVIVENKGEGSDYGAPIFRRIVEIYFTGRPVRPYWFESDFGITRTPTLPVTPTPQE